MKMFHYLGDAKINPIFMKQRADVPECHLGTLQGPKKYFWVFLEFLAIFGIKAIFWIFAILGEYLGGYSAILLRHFIRYVQTFFQRGFLKFFQA